MLPNWLHIGAAKCASSWLWRVCIEHPQIYVPTTPCPSKPDNVNFFTNGYHRGMDWYERTFFSEYAGEPVAGEFSNSYYLYPPALDRIQQHLPDVKMTLTLRPPIERAYLQWAHIHLKKKPSGLNMREGIGIPLEKALSVHGHSWFIHWIAPGFYARHIEEIWKRFSREQVFVMIYDDLRASEADFLKRFYAFLGVDASFVSSCIGQDINPDPDDWWDFLKPEVRDELAEVYRPDVERLSDLLDRDLSHWLA